MCCMPGGAANKNISLKYRNQREGLLYENPSLKQLRSHPTILFQIN